MDGYSSQDGLRQGIDSMVALESRLEQRLARLSGEASGYLEAPVAIDELHSLVTAQRETLQTHLQELADSEIPPAGAAIAATLEPGPANGGKPAEETLAALRALATALSEAAFGYAVLHGFAHRFFRPATAELADRHRRSYVRAAQAVHEAVGDVVVQKLQDAGHPCRCECPSCGPGICLCWHVDVEPDWTGPGISREGIVVRAPRAESNAERDGLRHGDVILEVDGHAVRSYQDMVGRMRVHEPGERVELWVRRGAGDPQELFVTR